MKIEIRTNDERKRYLPKYINVQNETLQYSDSHFSEILSNVCTAAL